MASRTVIQFGVFKVDLETGELQKDGVRLHIQEQPLKALRVLLQRPGELVTRDELKQALAPDTAFGDFDHALNVAIAKLRTVLNDSAETPLYIETLHKRGYRFIAPVSSSPQESSQDSTGPSTSVVMTLPATISEPLNSAQTRRHRRASIAILSLAMITAGASWLLWRYFQKSTYLEGTFTLTPLTSLPGVESCPKLSADGKELVFLWRQTASGPYDLYVKLVGSLKALRLTKGGAFAPAWLPDGKRIAYLSRMNGSLQIATVSTFGDDQTTLLSGIADRSPVCNELDFSPDGSRLYYSDLDPSGNISLRVYDLAAQRGEWLKAAMISGRESPSGAAAQKYTEDSPSVSPGGTHLAFFRRPKLPTSSSPDNQPGDIYVRDLRTGMEARLTFDMLANCGLSWTPDGKRIVAGYKDGGVWKHSPRHSAPPQRVNVTETLTCPSLSHSGQLVAIQRLPSSGSLWLYHLRGPAAAPERLFTSSRADYSPDISPDGHGVVFSSTRTGAAEIYVAALDAINPARLTTLGPLGCSSPRWSPDGKQIAFDYGDTPGHWVLYLMNADGTGLHRLTRNRSSEIGPNWSRDGRWIYFGSDQTGRWEIWRIPAGGGSATMLTREGGSIAEESLDGQSLYFSRYSSSDAGYAAPEIWRMPPAGGAAELIVQLGPDNTINNWRVAQSGIYFRDDRDQALKVYRFTNKKIELLHTVPSYYDGTAPKIAISQDEHIAVVSLRDPPQADIVLAQEKH